MQNKFIKVPLHFATIREIRKGHPHITEDSFTKKFPQNEKFLVGTDEKGAAFCLFIHDPKHPKIKGRFWSFDTNQNHFSFESELNERIKKAISKRDGADFSKDRENYYLSFGESDDLPGIFILKLKNHILIQFYTEFWKEYENKIVSFVKDAVPLTNFIWIQYRKISKKDEPPKLIYGKDGKKEEEFRVSEFNINYKIKMNESYDFGLYTDMASVRKKLEVFLKNKKSFLNLFCYTGAFSFYAESLGINEIVSVDLASRSRDWYFENLEINPQLDKNKHHFLKEDTLSAIKKLTSQNKKFDFILSDPPSFSHGSKNKKGGTNASSSIEEMILSLYPLLNDKGIVVLFSNTHSIKRDKLKSKITDFLKKNPNIKLKIVSELSLGEDAKIKKGFFESDYLKGFVLSR